MSTNLYYTTRRNTYYNPVTVLDEFLVPASTSGPNTWSGIFIPSDYVEMTMRLSSVPIIGQLIVITLTTYGINNFPDTVIGINWGDYPPCVGGVSDSFTRFNLACVGGRTNLPGVGAELHYQSSIWYRTVDGYDINEYNAGRGYSAMVRTHSSRGTGVATLTRLSGGQYWTTPIDNTTSYYPNGSGAYCNGSPWEVPTSSLIAGDPTGVDVEAGGIVIASCALNAGGGVAPLPTINNGFSSITAQQYQFGSAFSTTTAKKTYETSASNVNATFTSGSPYLMASSIAAFNP
jgi:hypothetical protein